MDKVLYITVFHRNVDVHLADGRVINKKSKLKDYDELVSNKKFVYIHRSTIVNIKHISELDHNFIKLNNGEILDISRRRYKSIETILNKYEFLK